MQMTSAGDIKKLGTLFCVSAHPDDETFTMGGIIAAARMNGQRVIVVTATRGELGVQDESRWPEESLGEIRTKELEQALRVLGVEHQFFLGVIDGECAAADEPEIVTRISRLMDTYQPDSIMTFGPDGLTGHPDHCTVSGWASKAKNRAGIPATIYHAVLTEQQYQRTQNLDKELNLFFNTPKPPTVGEDGADICLHLTGELFETKLAALAAMPSQCQTMLERFSKDELRGAFGTEAFVVAE